MRSMGEGVQAAASGGSHQCPPQSFFFAIHYSGRLLGLPLPPPTRESLRRLRRLSRGRSPSPAMRGRMKQPTR